MNTIINRLPLRARRHSLVLYAPAEDKLYHLFSTIEVLEPDMQDFNASDPQKDAKASDNLTSKSNEFNIYYHIETFDFTEKYYKSITEQYTLGKEPVLFLSDKFGEEPLGDVCYITDRNQTDINLSLLFPKRVGPYYIKTYIETERKVEKLVMGNENLEQQLSELSEKYYHTDLTKHPEHIGNVYLAWHHPSLKNIELTGCDSPNGIMVNVTWRRGMTEPLNVSVILHRQGTVTTGLVKQQIGAGKRRTFIPLPEYPQMLDFFVSDEDDTLLIMMKNVTFIRQFDITTGIMETRVLPKNDKDGKIVGYRSTNKYISEKYHVGKTAPNLSSYFKSAADLNVWEQEMKKEAVYIEHGKDENEVADSVNKAQATVREIINKARKECYVCDVFFGAAEVSTFLCDVQDIGVDVRILSSKETGNKANAKALKAAIDALNEAIGREQMKCRVLRGDDAPLHDRFIIADDKVWSIGTSLNQIGTKSTFIARVHASAAKKIKAEVEKWWNDDNYSEAIETYAKS